MPEPAHEGTRWVLTELEFDLLWEHLRLGPTPVVLRLPSPGRTTTERRQVLAGGWQALRERGLAGPGGPEPEPVRLLRLLARPAEQLELRGWWGRSVRAVAAGESGTGVLALRQDATVTLTPCGSLALGLLGVLPAAGPGPGRASRAPTAALSGALAGPTAGVRAALLAGDVPAADATLLARMLGEVRHRAQVVALVAGADGVPRRTGGVLGLLDGRRGRYLLTRCPACDGVDWSTVAPIDGRRLGRRIAELLEPQPEARTGPLG